MSDRDEPFGGVPEQGTDPVVWDPASRRFRPESERDAASPAPPPARGVSKSKGPDLRRYRIPSKAVGQELPPQPGTPPTAPPPADPVARPRQVVVPAPDAIPPRAADPPPARPPSP